MGENVKKIIVLVLALLTALAFTPFLFGTPDTTQRQVEVKQNSTDNLTTSTESVTQ